MAVHISISGMRESVPVCERIAGPGWGVFMCVHINMAAQLQPCPCSHSMLLALLLRWGHRFVLVMVSVRVALHKIAYNLV